MNRKLLVGFLLAGFLVCAASGCGSKVSKDNYDKIANGMTLAEVQKVLGTGVEETGGSAGIGGVSISGKVYAWKDGDKIIRVTLVNDKVISKAHVGL
jgi:hypothetical protein